MKRMTIEDATRKWVEEFNAVPQAVLQKLLSCDETLQEVTPYTEEELEEGLCDYFPMWGTMWAFGSSFDVDWIESGGLKLMKECGFRIYEQEDYEYIFGIDGAGYDFYEKHWIPLYKARELCWHDDGEEVTYEQSRINRGNCTKV